MENRIEKLDKRSYRIGMAVAFCECVAADCKKCALSHPIRPEEREGLEEDMLRVARDHGLKVYFDEAPDIPLQDRKCWWIFYKRDGVIEEYKALRAAGHYPARDLGPFSGVLSYGIAYRDTDG